MNTKEKVKTVSIAEIKELNRAAGLFFFEPSAMRFFRSKIVSQSAYSDSKGEFAYFVTSEQFVGSNGVAAPRTYTIRVCDLKTGRVSTEPNTGFQMFSTGKGAIEYAKRMGANR